MTDKELTILMLRDQVGEDPEDAVLHIAYTFYVAKKLFGMTWHTPMNRPPDQWENDKFLQEEDLLKLLGTMPYITPANRLDNQFGWVFSAVGKGKTEYPEFPITCELKVLFDSPSVGRRNPLIRTSLHMRGEQLLPSEAVVELFNAMVAAWEPVAGVISEHNSERGGWQIPVGSYLYLRDDVGAISRCTPGITVDKTPIGTYLYFSDQSSYESWHSWAREAVLQMTQTLHMNGLEELPH